MQDLKNRYKNFAIETRKLIQLLPRSIINSAYSNQLIRSPSSHGTNYRAACRGKSTADFINKLKIVEEVLDEAIYFLELIQHFNSNFQDKIEALIKESNQLLAMTVAPSKLSDSILVNRTLYL